MTETLSYPTSDGYRTNAPGIVLFLFATIMAGFFYFEGLDALVVAWATPEYSHGPLIPVLSLVLFLRQLKSEPINTGPKTRWPGVVLMVFALLLGAMGKLAGIADIVAYATILWIGAIVLISMGWTQGKGHWPSVLHLVFMLPLPGVIYYKISTYLQFVSSELGVLLLRLFDVPVYLEGNVIDLGVLKLQVAEACSGLRYLFPIMSFSYVFAFLYKGPTWHKWVLLLAAAPITVAMNSVRIAIAGILVQYLGLSYLEGFSHFFEGWVIFMISVIILFLLAWAMLKLQRSPMTLATALDLDTTGLWDQAKRLRLIDASRAMLIAGVMTAILSAAWAMRPNPGQVQIDRDPFALFPLSFDDWQSRPAPRYSDAIEATLGADDYYGASFVRPGSLPVDFFSAYYEDQTQGGIHSPEICLPGAGWEIALLEQIDVAPALGLDRAFELNRAIIQKGESRMLVYYWFDQHGRRVAWDFEAKFLLLWDGFTIQRTDGALVRLTTPIGDGESIDDAEIRLREMFLNTIAVLPRFVPEAPEFLTAE